MDYGILIFGFILIFLGGQYLVKSAANIACIFNLPHFVVGMLIVGIGTSVPEFAISFISLLQGHTDLLVGNVLGSNIANALLVLGLCGLTTSFHMVTSHRKVNVLLVAISAGLLLIGLFTDMIALLLGLIMLVTLVIGMMALYTKGEAVCPGDAKQHSTWLQAIVLLLSVIALTLGAKCIVSGAIAIATTLNISEAVIGVTIVAIGTSLPEIVFSLIALRHNHPDMVVGNVVGSNIFNILLGIGIPAIIHPIKTIWQHEAISIFAFIISTLLLTFFLVRNSRITRNISMGLLSLYIIFLASLVFMVSS